MFSKRPPNYQTDNSTFNFNSGNITNGGTFIQAGSNATILTGSHNQLTLREVLEKNHFPETAIANLYQAIEDDQRDTEKPKNGYGVHVTKWLKEAAPFFGSTMIHDILMPALRHHLGIF